MTSNEFADRPFELPRMDEKPMSTEQVAQHLTALPGWAYDEESVSITKRYAFPDFADALAFTNQVGALAETLGHHPEITVGWGSASIRLSTHDIGGIHLADLIIAARIDRIQPS